MDLYSFALAQQLIISVILLLQNCIIHSVRHCLIAFPLITADSRLSRPSHSSLYLRLPGAIKFPRCVNSLWGGFIHSRLMSLNTGREQSGETKLHTVLIRSPESSSPSLTFPCSNLFSIATKIVILSGSSLLCSWDQLYCDTSAYANCVA